MVRSWISSRREFQTVELACEKAQLLGWVPKRTFGGTLFPDNPWLVLRKKVKNQEKQNTKPRLT